MVQFGHIKQKKFVPQKQIHFGYVKLHAVSMETYFTILKNGSVPKNTNHIYFSSTLSYSSKLGIKLVGRHSTFDMDNFVCISS